MTAEEAIALAKAHSPKWKFVAMDMGGRWFAFEQEPRRLKTTWRQQGIGATLILRAPSPRPISWAESLTEVPQ